MTDLDQVTAEPVLAEAIMDPAAAARAEIAAEITRLNGDLALHDRAISAVQRKIAEIETNDLQPIRHEREILRLALDRKQAEADMADWLQVARTEAHRASVFQEASQLALSAYRNAQAAPFADKVRVQAEWDAVLVPHQAKKTLIGTVSQAGVYLTEDQHRATYYPKFLALTRRMNQLARTPG